MSQGKKMILRDKTILEILDQLTEQAVRLKDELDEAGVEEGSREFCVGTIVGIRKKKKKSKD
jgi:hypothetical protein